jgi:hypothetical protein
LWGSLPPFSQLTDDIIAIDPLRLIARQLQVSAVCFGLDLIGLFERFALLGSASRVLIRVLAPHSTS